MPDHDKFEVPPEQERLSQILKKTVEYQHSLPDGRAVELDELRRAGVLEPADIEFLNSNSVTYKPHRVSDYHALDMFRMPTSNGGCFLIGPDGPPLKQRRAQLRDFQGIVENFLQLPRPRDELGLFIELSEHDGMDIAPEMIGFIFGSMQWQERLPAIRAVAAEFVLRTFQDQIVQASHILTLTSSAEPARAAAATVALLSRGCGFGEKTKIVYSAGALDER
jgi:hypothetical protein